jgi:uncharacterized iron-regulated membrane protein
MLVLLKFLIGPIIAACITGLVALLTSWLNSQRDQRLGATQVVAATATQSAKVETAIAQAEATAPKTQAQDVSAFETGQV